MLIVVFLMYQYHDHYEISDMVLSLIFSNPLAKFDAFIYLIYFRRREEARRLLNESLATLDGH